MKKKVKIIGGAVLGILIIAAVLGTVLAPLGVEAITLEATTARISFTEQGVLQYEDTVQVYPMLDGELLELRVKEGDGVAQGDPLAVVSAKDVEYEIARLESNIKGYQAQIQNIFLQDQQEKDTLAGTKDNLRGQLAALEAQIGGREGVEESRKLQIELQQNVVALDRGNVRIARDNLRNFRQDYDEYDYDTKYGYDAEYNALREALQLAEKAVSDSELQLARLQNSDIPEGYYQGQQESLQAQISSIDSRLDKNYTAAMQSYYAAMIESDEANLQQLTERKGEAVIASPMSGVVVRLTETVRGILGQNTCIATIGSNPLVEVFVPIREIDSVHVGDGVELIIGKRLGDEVLAGTIDLVENRAEARLSALGVEERKVRVLVRPSSTVSAGFSMDVRFTVLEQKNCIVVPKTAVFEKDGQDTVWIIENRAARLCPVQKGIETREGFVVDSGLSIGDAVVIDAKQEGLSDGKRVAAR